MIATMASAEVGARLLASVAVVVAVGAAGAWVANRLRQPAVLGQIAAGVLVGPSLLGAVAPRALELLVPLEVTPALSGLGQLGLVLLMFLVGTEVDPRHLVGSGRRALVISQVSIVVPFVLGAGAAVWIHHVLDLGGDLLPFAAFLGIAMSVTAFPVLARIIADVGLAGTRIGTLALTCAAFDDVTAWCALAVVVATVGAASWSAALLTAGLSVAFVVVMLTVVRPWFARRGTPSVAAAVAVALAGAFLTETIGIHAIFGAFVAGVAVGAGERDVPGIDGALPPRPDLATALGPVVDQVLLPVYFVVVGSSTRLGVLDSIDRWAVLVVVLLVAVAGKLGGTLSAARLQGERPRDAWTLGILLNTRGLTEIVILTVGRDVGIIDESVFTIMVVMALVTTFAAGPLLRRLGVGSPGVAGATTLVPPHSLE